MDNYTWNLESCYCKNVWYTGQWTTSARSQRSHALNLNECTVIGRARTSYSRWWRKEGGGEPDPLSSSRRDRVYCASMDRKR